MINISLINMKVTSATIFNRAFTPQLTHTGINQSDISTLFVPTGVVWVSFRSLLAHCFLVLCDIQGWGNFLCNSSFESMSPRLLYSETLAFLPPAKEICEGNVFTPVCHCLHGAGVGLWFRGTSGSISPFQADMPLGRTPPPLGRHLSR